MTPHYKIANWGEYQHYKHRNPPWVRLYFDMLGSETWVASDDATRCLMVACILVASRNDGCVPSDPAYIRKMAYLNSPPDFKPLILNGFLDASNALAVCTQDASSMLAPSVSLFSDTQLEEEKKNKQRDRERKQLASEMLADGFKQFWSVYPRKKAKMQAELAWAKINPNEELRGKIMEALAWQVVQPDWTKDGGNYAPYPATYLNKRRWEDELGLPPQMNGSTAPARRLRVWEIPVPDDQLWAVEGRREMGQVYRDGLWVRFEDLDPDDPDYRAPEVSNG